MRSRSEAQHLGRASLVVAVVIMMLGIFASSASAFPKYSYSFSIGSEGSGSGQFNQPEGITTDSLGNVYVADRGNNRIQKFNSKGEFQKEFGKPKLSQPNDIAIDSKGNFWVVQDLDTETVHKVVKFNSSGVYMSSFGTYGEGNGQFTWAMRIDIDSKDNIWISDLGGNVRRLQEFNSEGKYIRQINATTIGKEFQPGGSIAIDSKDNVWSVDSNSENIFKFNSEGSFLSEITVNAPFLAWQGLEIDAEDRIWVSVGNETSNLLVLNASGEMLGQVGEPEPGGVFFQPEDIAVDPSGNPWARNLSNGSITKWLALPEATTEAATEVKTTEAKLNAQVNPQRTSTTYQFEYGPTTSYGSKAPVSPESVGAGNNYVAVSKAISGLTPGATYHFRVAATSAAGTTYGTDKVFTAGLAPQNKQLPQLSQVVAAEGVPVSTTGGKWNGVPAATLTFQWRRCNAEGSGCANISGATATTYTPVASDVGYTLVAAVTATNTFGSATAYSAPSGKIKALGGIAEFSLPAGGAPLAIANGPGDGNAWYSGGAISGLAKITTSGTVTEYSVAGGSPVGIMSGVGAKVWFAGAGKAISNMTTTGTITEFPTSKGNVLDVAPVGGLAWFTATSGMIGSVTKGNVLTEYPVPGMSPARITAGPEGKIWFTEDSSCEPSCSIGKMTTSGEVTKYSLPSGVFAYDITMGPDGNLWFTIPNSSKGKIGKITTSGVVTTYTIPGGGSPYPRGIAAGPDGSLWFTEKNASRIGRITTAGSLSNYALPAGSEPFDIAQGPDGLLWFTNHGTNKIGTIVP